MKKISLLFFFSFLLHLVIGCQGEESDIATDYAPVRWNIIVKDADGNNLFDPAFEGNIIDQTYILYKGEKYTVVDKETHEKECLEYSNGTRQISRTIAPVYFCHPWVDYDFPFDMKDLVLIIGEWYATSFWDNETVYLYLPDNTQVVLSFSLHESGIGKGIFKVDGQKVNDYIVTYIKQGDHFIRQ